MDWVNIYKQTKTDIIFLQLRIDTLEEEYRLWYNSLRNGTKKPLAGMEDCLKRMDKIKEDCQEYMSILEMHKNTLKQMDKQLDQLDWTEYEIIKLNLLQGKKLIEVADILNISHIWAKKLSSRARKKIVYREYTQSVKKP